MMKAIVILILCGYIELQIHSRPKILDLGHMLTTRYYNNFKQLNIITIKQINIFYALCALTPIPIMIIDKNIQNIYLIGMVLRCICGSLTQLPYNNDNKGFNHGELGGFGKNKSMIWFFSGHCYSISCTILFFYQSKIYLMSLFFTIIQISIIFWYLAIRAHYSIDMFVGTSLPFIISKLIRAF